MKKKRLLIFIPLGVVVVLLSAWLVTSGPKSGVRKAGYETVKVQTGDIRETVSGTGNLQAVGTVKVLTQLTGTVERLYVDFNDQVKKGQPLAALNTDMLKISRKEAEAALLKARAQLGHDQLQLESNKKLFERKLISEFDLHASQTAFDMSRGSLLQAEAGFERAMLNLTQYAVVLSPITGVVLQRNIDEGSTVVAGASSDSQILFSLAENLKTMEIQVQVDEMDISKVVLDQPVRFTITTYADRNFDGKVRQIQLVPKTADSVVKYVVVVTASNQDGLLLPGMTATVEFIVAEKKNVLLVANGALRFKPAPEIETAARRKLLEVRFKDRSEEERATALKRFDEAQKKSSGGAPAAGGQSGGQNSLLAPSGGMRGGFGQPKQQNQAAANGAAGAPGAAGRTLWLLEADGSLSLRLVKLGVTDGANTEILEAGDLDGRAAVTKAR